MNIVRLRAIARSAVFTAIPLLLACATALALAGCVQLSPEDVPDWALPEGVSGEPTTTPPPESSGDGSSAYPLPRGHHGIEVLMLGRSVMQGWFSHWDWNGRDPVLRDGYALYYAEVEGPPGIARSAGSWIEQVPDGTIVVFKLCFVDFEADSSGDVEAKLAENAGYAEEIVAATRGRDITLVLDTALPRVVGETTPALAELHRRYNERLTALATANEGVYVLDLYGALESDGALPRGLAVSPDDSHLNDVAYQVLDEELFGLLDGIAK